MTRAGFAKRERGITVELDVPAPMRDGVVLRADVYRPTGEGPWPTLVVRTPYDKNLIVPVTPLAREGFMVVVQDTRGRFASEGAWEPLRYERQDGHDTVEWAARLPGSSGRVGMFGASYDGSTVWQAALAAPPSLLAIAPMQTWADPCEGLIARGGAVELGKAIPAALGNGLGLLARLPLSAAEHAEALEAMRDEYDRLPDEGYWQLPVHEALAQRCHGAPDLGAERWLDDPDAPVWGRVSGEHEHVRAASLIIGSWYDNSTQGTLDNYTALAALGRPARIVMGPWGHLPRLMDPIGELSFGLRANAHGGTVSAEGDLVALQLAWFRRHLDPDAPPATPDDAAPVRIFTMGRNAWRDEPAWPLAHAREERWHLHAGGGLTVTPPTVDAPASEYVYDPADPVPTLGGNTILPTTPPGAYDQARIEARADVLVFTSEPLAAELEVTGRVRVVLHAESSAPSTDWVARLCDVHPDGRSFNLCDGIVRIAADADRPGRIEIDLWSTSNAFLPGHRLRVHVTSSSFPRWDRNLNTGDQRAAAHQPARQRVHHDAQRPSWIELPVVDQ